MGILTPVMKDELFDDKKESGPLPHSPGRGDLMH
jgi:hypothetical protein